MARLYLIAVLVVSAFSAPAFAQTQASYDPGAIFQDCRDCPELVVIPAGRFMMGTSEEETKALKVEPHLAMRERPVHEVRLAKPFAMSRYEITRGEWAAFVKATGHALERPCRSVRTPENQKDGEVWKKQIDYSNDLTWDRPGFNQTDRHPVICLSMEDGTAYVAWLSKETGKTYRIPSEAEWEYAARGGTRDAFPFPYDPKTICKFANTSDKSFEAYNPKLRRSEAQCDDGFVWSSPVGTYPPNAFGLYDLVGNAWEWVADCYHDSYDGAPNDGSAWKEQEDCEYAVRSGGWFSAASGTRPSFRVPDPGAYRGIANGLRIVREIP
jgi:formylglycine-generating enzyme required for sulfatase activity